MSTCTDMFYVLDATLTLQLDEETVELAAAGTRERRSAGAKLTP